MQWMTELVTAYPSANVSKRTFQQLERLLGGYETAIIEEAVDRYILDNPAAHQFPTAGALHQLCGQVVAEQLAAQKAVAQYERRQQAWRAEFETWAACEGGCGERIPPNHEHCPFCADWERIRSK